MPEQQSNEWQLLLACSAISTPRTQDRIRALSRAAIDWPALFALADKHGVSALLYQSLSNAKSTMPPAVLGPLAQRYQTNVHKSLLVARELIRILDALNALSLDVLPYKGPALAEAIYGDLALRQAGDIDLLVRPQDFPRIKDVVRDLGYWPHAPLTPPQEHAYLRSGYECPFDSAAGRNLLEIQWAFQPRFYSVDADLDGLFQRAVPINVAGRATKTLSLEDLLIVLSVHAAKHAWERLIWLCDIARIAGCKNLNWKWVQEQAQSLGIVRILAITFLLTNQLLEAPIPAAYIEICEDPDCRALADQIRTQIIHDSAPETESVAYFRLMLNIRERFSDRARFLSRLAFTPGPGEWSAVDLPEPLFPLYRIVRLGRLMRRTLGLKD